MDLILHALDRIETFNDRLDGRIDYIQRRLAKMAVDQAAFDQALADFASELDSGIVSIQTKIDELEASTGVDLSAELESLTAARDKFAAAVTDATDGPPPAP